MREIPLFPLNTVLFPGVPLHLFIFEDRYKLMLRNALTDDGLLGIVLIHQGLEALGPLPEPYRVGTLARITEQEILPDGCMNVTVVGLDRFRILSITTDTLPYLTASVETYPFGTPHLLQVHRQARQLAVNLLHYLKEINPKEFYAANLKELNPPEDPMSLVFLAAALLQIPPHEKQPILEAESISEMMVMVERLYRRENGLMRTINAAGDLPARRAAWLN